MNEEYYELKITTDESYTEAIADAAAVL